MLRNLTLLTAALMLLLTACTGSSQTTQQTVDRPEDLVFPELNPIQVPEVHEFEYNGITFYLVEDNEVPLINLNTIIRAGSWMQPMDQVGLASITGEVMRSGGTASLSADELNEFLESRAASMETSFGLASGSARMNVLKEDFEELLPVFIELLTAPAFPEERLELTKTQRRSGISRRNDSPAGIAGREFQNLIYGRQTVFSNTLEYDHLNNINIDDLKAFHSNAVNANNLMVGIVGDFNVEEIRPVLEAAFGEIEQGERNEFDFPEIDYTFESTINFIPRSDMNQSIIRMGHIGGLRDNPDYTALQVMNQVLSGGFSGRLMQEVRTRLGLAYSVSGNFGSSVLYEGQFFAGLSTAGETTAQAIEATISEIRRLQDELVPQSELDDTRERFLNSLVFRNASRSSALNEQINNAYLGLPFDAFERYVEEVREVTPEDIQRVAREYLRPDAMHILVVGNPDLVGNQLDQFGDVREIDITIPRPGSMETREVVSGDTEAGREWLDKMAAQILSSGPVDEIVYEGRMQSAQLPGGMIVDVVMTYDFANGNLTQMLNTPMGSQAIKLENGRAFLEAGGQRQDLPGNFADNLRNLLDRHYASIAMKASDLSPEYLGMQSKNGLEYAVILLSDLEVKLWLNPETSLPDMITFDEFNPETGGDVEVVSMYENWNEKDGVKSSWLQTQEVDGSEMSRFEFSTHSAN
ncbi:MAG: insulinase family protein [Balneolia bacterium]|nr:insulinase family protein [Balneolia bacterium]